MKSVVRASARLAGITVALMALFSACSSPPAEGAKQDANPPAGKRGAGATEDKEAVARERKAKAKDDALIFVGVAQKACRELSRKTEALTLDSTVDSSGLNSFIPAELYPTDPFVIYVGEATFADVRSQLFELVNSVVELIRSLEHSKLTSVARIERQPDEVVKDQVAFRDKKLKTLASTQTYCESVRRAGAGVGTLH